MMRVAINIKSQNKKAGVHSCNLAINRYFVQWRFCCKLDIRCKWKVEMIYHFFSDGNFALNIWHTTAVFVTNLSVLLYGTLTQERKKVECNISGEANILIPPAGKDREGRGREEVGRGTQRIHFNNILKVNIFWPPGQRTRGCCWA